MATAPPPSSSYDKPTTFGDVALTGLVIAMSVVAIVILIVAALVILFIASTVIWPGWN
jgi:hypothetical protein